MKELLEYVKKQVDNNFNKDYNTSHYFKDYLCDSVSDFIKNKVKSLIKPENDLYYISGSKYDIHRDYIRGNKIIIRFNPKQSFDTPLEIGTIKYKVQEVMSDGLFIKKIEKYILTDIKFYIDGKEFNGTVKEYADIVNEKLRKDIELRQFNEDRRKAENTYIVNKLKQVFPEIKDWVDIKLIFNKLDSSMVDEILKNS